MQTGIIGLPQVGKTTLFKILTKASLDARGQAATHVGIARVPEPRLLKLAEIFKPKKITYATIEYVDVGGLAKEKARESASPAHLKIQWFRILPAPSILCAMRKIWIWN
jgi:ribosome-binding ATPase